MNPDDMDRQATEIAAWRADMRHMAEECSDRLKGASQFLRTAAEPVAAKDPGMAETLTATAAKLDARRCA